MVEHPILFRGQMVRAIVEGRKTAGTRWADNPWVWVVEFKRVNGEAASD